MCVCLISETLLCWCWCRLAAFTWTAGSIRLQRARSVLQGGAALSAARTHLHNNNISYSQHHILLPKIPAAAFTSFVFNYMLSFCKCFLSSTLATVGESRPWVGVSGGLGWWWGGWITLAAVLFILRAIMGEAEPTSNWVTEEGVVGWGGLTEDRGWGLGELWGLWVFRSWSVSWTFGGSICADLAGGVDSDTHLLITKMAIYQDYHLIYTPAQCRELDQYLRRQLRASVRALTLFNMESILWGSSFKKRTASTSSRSTERIFTCSSGNSPGREPDSRVH